MFRQGYHAFVRRFFGEGRICMKKLVLFSLCVILVFSAIPVTQAADSGFIRLVFCDSADDFVNGSYPTTAVTTDGTLYTDAPASV